jgi:cell division initiation protein
MRLTALDIREQQFRRIMRGFDPDEVMAFLGTVAGEYEQLVAENRDIRQRLLDLEHQIAEFQNMEKALRDTLLTAERVTAETRENAQKEAGLILREAEMAAQQATAGISAEILQKRRELGELQQRKRDYLFSLRALAQSHLQMIDSAAQRVDEEWGSVSTPAPKVVSGTPPTPPSPGPAVPETTFSPLPSEVGGVIPSAVAPPSSGGAPGVPAHDVARRQPVPDSDWAEASFEPGDLVPRKASPLPMSAREAELYRRGITPGEPLPSLLKSAGADVEHEYGDDVAQAAVRLDGGQGD